MDLIAKIFTSLSLFPKWFTSINGYWILTNEIENAIHSFKPKKCPIEVNEILHHNLKNDSECITFRILKYFISHKNIDKKGLVVNYSYLGITSNMQETKLIA